jgi:L-fucose mutarotase
MLLTRLIHPGILQALAGAGHGSTVLISDGNFPHATGPRPEVPRVYLNLTPGRLLVTEVLEALTAAVPIESAVLMRSPEPVAPAVHDAVRSLLPAGTPIELLDRFDFYEATRSTDLALVIATADQRLYANVLLRIGVVG